MAVKKVSSDIAYQEMYQEMRRYRDYELSVSAWYTTLLIAILGGIIAAKFGDLGLTQLDDTVWSNPLLPSLFL